jgi:hypothetical protein
MAHTRSRGSLERGALQDVWRHTLSRIPSVYGRLIYLTSLRNNDSGKYEHHGLSLVFGEVEADRALKATHVDAFYTWINYELREQKADMELYLSAVTGSKREAVETWARVQPYRNVTPATVREAERALFIAHFETLLNLLTNVYGVSFRDPDA